MQNLATLYGVCAFISLALHTYSIQYPYTFIFHIGLIYALQIAQLVWYLVRLACNAWEYMKCRKLHIISLSNETWARSAFFLDFNLIRYLICLHSRSSCMILCAFWYYAIVAFYFISFTPARFQTWLEILQFTVTI